ncbi:concanavalin A-like lectin/glucanase domain-containing protein [Peziza echinospora]|nr:concanavalin A-like lectin/glucanase domain-containing protein [Peziza echinospora]
MKLSPNFEAAGKGVLIGLASAFGSAALVGLIFYIIYFFKYTARGRIFLDRIGRPGEFDDEQAYLREESEALESMDDISRQEYLRAKAFIQANPPDSIPTDISLSQFLAIQEKGVSAWEFEAELEIANCFVEARTEIEFFDSVCSVQSNLPVPKQNEVYYWEAKMLEKPETTMIAIGFTTKPYPMFRLPGYHKNSLSYTSTGQRRYNQPFSPTIYGPAYHQGDVVGVGYRPRTGTVFFTRNGKKLDDVAHGIKSLNLFPTVGANGPCTVHVNFGQSGFVFIEANVKKWGLAPASGSLAPPPPYGNEQGSILLEGGRANQNSQTPSYIFGDFQSNRTRVPVRSPGHGRSQSTPSGGSNRVNTSGSHPSRPPNATLYPPTSPGPLRSPTEISLAPINVSGGGSSPGQLGPPPEYSSPMGSPRNSSEHGEHERQPLLQYHSNHGPTPPYDHIVGRIGSGNNNNNGYDANADRMV